MWGGLLNDEDDIDRPLKLERDLFEPERDGPPEHFAPLPSNGSNGTLISGIPGFTTKWSSSSSSIFVTVIFWMYLWTSDSFRSKGISEKPMNCRNIIVDISRIVAALKDVLISSRIVRALAVRVSIRISPSCRSALKSSSFATPFLMAVSILRRSLSNSATSCSTRTSARFFTSCYPMSGTISA